MGGEVCPRVFCITALVWLAMNISHPIYRRGGHLFRQAQTGKDSLSGLPEPGHYLSGKVFQAISDSSSRFEEGVSRL